MSNSSKIGITLSVLSLTGLVVAAFIERLDISLLAGVTLGASLVIAIYGEDI